MAESEELADTGEDTHIHSEHNITDMAQLVQTIETINKKYKDLADNIRKAERRLDTLSQHITQYESRRAHRAVYNEYAKLKDPKKLTAAKYAACERYYALQDEVRSVELNKGAENIMREDAQKRQYTLTQGMEL